MEDRFLTVQEFAQIMRVKVNSIQRYIRMGRIHAFRLGTGKRCSYRIPYTEIGRLQAIGFEETLKTLAPLLKEISF